MFCSFMLTHMLYFLSLFPFLRGVAGFNKSVVSLADFGRPGRDRDDLAMSVA